MGERESSVFRTRRKDLPCTWEGERHRAIVPPGGLLTPHDGLEGKFEVRKFEVNVFVMPLAISIE